jgi:hypothetical protein
LCRGAPPGQAKLLEQVLKILKTPNKVREVDVAGMIQSVAGSTTDKGVVDWLKSQLTDNDQQKREIAFLGANNTIMSDQELNSRKNLRKRLSLTGQTGQIVSLRDNVNNVSSLKSDSMDGSLEYSKTDGPDALDHTFALPLANDNLYPSNPPWYTDLTAWEFDVFSIGGETPLASLMWEALNLVGSLEKIQIHAKKMQNFILFLDTNYSQRNYGDNEEDVYGVIHSLTSKNGIKKEHQGLNKGGLNTYHNNLHAADVLQAVLHFSLNYKEIGGDFTALDLFSILFAAAVHDFVSCSCCYIAVIL